MKALAPLHPDKVALSYFASIQRQVTRQFKKSYPNPQAQDKQLECLKKILIEFLKEGNNKENQCENATKKDTKIDVDLENITIQEELLEKDQKIEKLQKQLDLQFEMTRRFLDNFRKEQITGRDSCASLKDLTRRDSLNVAIRLKTSCSISETTRPAFTERDSQLSNSNQTLKEQKTLAKLNKLQKFLYKPRQKVEKATNITWDFSPTKADYKFENQKLKILQENLRIQLDKPSHGDQTNKKEQAIRDRERKCLEREEALFKKQMELNKRHMLILRKEKRLKL